MIVESSVKSFISRTTDEPQIKKEI